MTPSIVTPTPKTVTSLGAPATVANVETEKKNIIQFYKISGIRNKK